jgi:hypothetical protein
VVTTVCRIALSYYLALCVNYFVYSMYDVGYNSFTGGNSASNWSMASLVNSVLSVIVGLGLSVHKIITVRRLNIDSYIKKL